jgi:subtilisin family serine protease
LKVAILDSGIDYDHADFDGPDKDRIKETKSFINGDPNVDAVKHGTHIAATILRLTENVDLWIGQITDSRDVEQKKYAIAEVSCFIDGCAG